MQKNRLKTTKFGVRLRAALDAKNLTLGKFATKIGVNRVTLSRAINYGQYPGVCTKAARAAGIPAPKPAELIADILHQAA